MMTKMIEIRDEGTCIPALAIQMSAADAVEREFLMRSGYPPDAVVLMRLADQKATVDPYDWGEGARTMPLAHDYIYTHFGTLSSGQVVDVRVILGDAEVPVAPEIWTGPLPQHERP